jgi:probable rRNA maturation factor
VSAAGRLELALQYAAPRRHLPARSSIASWLRAALAGCRARVTVRFVGAAEGRRLNREFRRRKRATNVLTFAYDAGAGRLAGDIVLCAPVIAREARDQAKPLRAHYAHLAVHGALHLRGYDHERRRDAVRMETEERRILADLGFPDPYGGRGIGMRGERKRTPSHLGAPR